MSDPAGRTGARGAAAVMVWELRSGPKDWVRWNGLDQGKF